MKKMKFKAVHVNKLDAKTISEIRIWRNKPFVRQNMFTQREITEEEHEKYIEGIRNNEAKGLFVFFLDDKPFGVYQYAIDKSDNSVTGGNYLIDEEYQTLGYGVIQLYYINIIMIYYLGVTKSIAEVIDTNKRALQLLRGNNNSQEECLKDHILIEGVLHDVYRFTYNINAEGVKKDRIGKVVRHLVDDDYDIII